jgi:hypothetical protein
MNTSIVKCGIASALLVLPFVACAHHSNAEYDRNTVLELEGEIVEVVWRNPHVGLTINTAGEGGAEALWKMEAADLIGTVRRGVPAGTFVVGQRVKVAGFPSTRREGRLLVSNVLLPDGVEVLMFRTETRWSERTIGGAEWVVPDTADGGAPGEGLFKVWTPGRTARPSFVENPPLTPAARAAHAQWDSFDDPALDCVAIGMPRAMTRPGPHPIEFAAQPDGDILLRMEYFDLERVIHMSAEMPPAETEPSPLGYSLGEWQGDTLVVTTTHVSWPYFDINGLEGVPQSENAAMTEKFAVGESGNELTYSITVTDPAAFTEPVVAADYSVWEWRPGVAVLPYECTL